MPKARDHSTRDAILDAAEELFAARGFERTTIKDIGRVARVNSALLYYYYRDKTELYQAVLSRIVESLKARAVPVVREAPSLETLVRGLLAAQTQMLTKHPRAATLLFRELVEHDAAHGTPMMVELAADLFRPACRALEAAQRNGEVRPDLDVRFGAISTIAQMVYFTLAQAAVRVLLEQTASFPTPKDLAAFSAHAATFAIHAMAAPSPRRPGPAPRTRSTRRKVSP